MKFFTTSLILCALHFTCYAIPVTIDFEAFPTGNFTNGMEDGFTITATGNDPEIFSLGNPGRSIGEFDIDTTSTYTFTTTGNFQFTSIDLNDGNGVGGITVDVRGFLGGPLVATDQFTVGTTYMTFAATNLSGQMLDRVEVEITNVGGSAIDGDNVVFDTVPEPSTYALLSLLGIGFLLHRRRTAKA